MARLLINRAPGVFFGAELDAGDDVLLETGRVAQIDKPALALSVADRRPFAIMDAETGASEAKLELMGPVSSRMDEVQVTPEWEGVPDAIQTWPELGSDGGHVDLRFGSIGYPCSLDEALSGPRQGQNLRFAATLDEPKNLDGVMVEAVMLDPYGSKPGRIDGIRVAFMDAQGCETPMVSPMSVAECVPSLRDLGFSDTELASVRDACNVIESMDENVYGPHLSVDLGASVNEMQQVESFNFDIADLEGDSMESLGATSSEQRSILDNERSGWSDVEREEFGF